MNNKNDVDDILMDCKIDGHRIYQAMSSAKRVKIKMH